MLRRIKKEARDRVVSPLLREVMMELHAIHLEHEATLFGIGQMYVRLARHFPPASLQEAEFRVFSQWGEDGIIQYLLSKVAIAHDTFVEFGVGNYRESNTRFLLTNNNWRGLIIDGGT